MPTAVFKTEELLVNMGPQHPSTHGVLRLVVTLDGEVVRDVIPHVGYLHRGQEWLAQHRTYNQYIIYTDRWDYLNAMGNNLVWARAVEKAMGIEVPERAQFIRVIMAELQRIASHLVWLGTFGLDLGALSLFIYCFREREKIVDLFEAASGGRLTYTYIRPGGTRFDLPDNFVERAKEFCDYFLPKVDEYDALFTGNEIFLVRAQGIGILDPDEAISLGVSGPTLRGSGIPFDIRRTDPYEVYDRLDFEVAVENTKDVLGRYLVRTKEMRESIKIINQALKFLPEGEFTAKVPKTLRPPAGVEVYSHVESPRGDLGVHLITDGSPTPARLKIRAPSFINLQALKSMAVGLKVADLVAILGSIDIVLGEVDK